VYFDQRYNASTWMPLGEYVMEPGLGHKIVLSNDSLDGLMAADAIRFEVIDDLPAVVADAIKLVSNDGEDLTYVHADHLGAPQKMTDKDRSVVWDASFLPFGEEESLIGSAANDNRFPGQRLSSETGLHYNYFRDYDPTTGRYLQSDPIGLAGGINTYRYVSGNPVNYVDPKGENAVKIILKLLEKTPIGKKIVDFCKRKIGDLLGKPKLTPEQLKSIRSLEKRILEHKYKLKNSKDNPSVRPGMEKLPRDLIKKQQESRIRHLEKEIRTFKKNITKIKKGKL